MIEPTCAKCGKVLEDFGAIWLSSPDNHSEYTRNGVQVTYKLHICIKCEKKVNDFIYGEETL